MQNRVFYAALYIKNKEIDISIVTYADIFFFLVWGRTFERMIMKVVIIKKLPLR